MGRVPPLQLQPPSHRSSSHLKSGDCPPNGLELLKLVAGDCFSAVSGVACAVSSAAPPNENWTLLAGFGVSSPEPKDGFGVFSPPKLKVGAGALKDAGLGSSWGCAEAGLAEEPKGEEAAGAEPKRPAGAGGEAPEAGFEIPKRGAAAFGSEGASAAGGLTPKENMGAEEAGAALPPLDFSISSSMALAALAADEALALRRASPQPPEAAQRRAVHENLNAAAEG